MREADFKSLLQTLETLPPHQRKRLRKVLTKETGMEELSSLVSNQTPSCPHCDAEEIQKWGHQRGLPRYRCKQCKRLFDPLTGTPLSKLRHRKVWMPYLHSLLEGKSVQDAAAEVGVHPSTSYRWRKRFLALLSNQRDRETAKLEGIVETDETFLLESSKGRPREREGKGREPRKRGGKARGQGRSRDQVHVLVARDRSGRSTESVWEKFNVVSLSATLLPRISPDSIVVSDSFSSYKSFARQSGLQHELLNSSAGVRKQGPFHLQNVNSYHSRLKRFFSRFNGISTHYLKNYVDWFHFVDRHYTPNSLLSCVFNP